MNTEWVSASWLDQAESTVPKVSQPKTCANTSLRALSMLGVVVGIIEPCDYSTVFDDREEVTPG